MPVFSIELRPSNPLLALIPIIKIAYVMKEINRLLMLASRLAIIALTALTLSCGIFESEEDETEEDEPINQTNEISSISDSDGSSNQVVENAKEGSTVGITAYASDADSGDTVSYSLTDDANDLFTINSSSGVVTVASGASIDYETATSHNIEVKATSSDGTTSTKAFGIEVLDEDESTDDGDGDDNGDATNSIGAISDIDNSSNKVDENASVGTAVGITAYADDADAGDSVSYTLSDSAGNKFAIHETSGVVTVNAKLNYESAASHSITVQATSSDGSFMRKSFGIEVIDDPNESNDGTSNDVSAVTDTNTSDDEVEENAANGSLVGITAYASDADEGEGVSYSLLRDADGRFGIDTTSGVVSVADGSKLNYERERAHTIEVLATSDDTSTSSAEFVISVIDVADESATDQHDVTAPEDADSSDNQVDESASIGTTVGITAYATDADDGDGVRYSLARSANGRFKIDGTSGVVTTAKALDYEADPSHYITVNANSDDGSVASTEFNIAVKDAAEISTTISGVAVDGYLQGANVCLDKDGDQKCTAADSAVATTTADGGYSLVVDAGDAELYPVLVQVIGGTTIDSDDPNGEPVAKDSIMNAPAGKYSLVSPLTTLVQGKIADNSGLDADAAERLVIDDLGIDSDSNLSLFDDYVAEKQNTDLDSEAQADYDFVHSVAQLVAQAIADNIEKVSNDLNESTTVDADGEDFNEVVQIVVTEVGEDLSEVAEAVDEAIEQTEEGEEVNLTAVYQDIDDELTVDANASEIEEEVALLEHESEAQSGTSVADFMAAGFHNIDSDDHYDGSDNICYEYDYSDIVISWDNSYSLRYDYDKDSNGGEFTYRDDSDDRPSYLLVNDQWLYQPERPLELLAEYEDGSIDLAVSRGEEKIAGETLDVSGEYLLSFVVDDGWAEVIESYDPTFTFSPGAEILSIYEENLFDSYWIDAESDCHSDINATATCSWLVEEGGDFYAQELSDLLDGDIFRSGSLGYYDVQFEGELNASDVYSSTGLVHFYADEENASLVATAEWYIVELADEASLKFKVPLALLNDDDGSDAPYYLITPLDGALHYVEHRPAGFVIEDAGTFFNRVAMDDILSAFNSSSQASTNACSLDDDDDGNNGSDDGDGSGDNGSGDGSGDNNSSDSYQSWNVNDILGKTLYLVYEDLDYYSDSGSWASSGNVINTIQFGTNYSNDQSTNINGNPYQGLFGYVDGAVDSVDSLTLTWRIDGNGILHLAEDAEGEDITEMAKVSSSTDYYEIQAISDDDGSVFDDFVKESALEYLYFNGLDAEAACADHSLGCSDSPNTNGPNLAEVYEGWNNSELSGNKYYFVSPESKHDDEVSFYAYYVDFQDDYLIMYDSFNANSDSYEVHNWSLAEDGVLDIMGTDNYYVIGKFLSLDDGSIQVVYRDDRDGLQGYTDEYEMYFPTESAANAYCQQEQDSDCIVKQDVGDLYQPWQESQLKGQTFYKVQYDESTGNWWQSRWEFSSDYWLEDTVVYVSFDSDEVNQQVDWHLTGDGVLEYYGEWFALESVLADDAGFQVRYVESDYDELIDVYGNGTDGLVYLYRNKSDAESFCSSVEVGGCVLDDNDNDGNNDSSNNDDYDDWHPDDFKGLTIYLVYTDYDYVNGEWQDVGNVISTVVFENNYSYTDDYGGGYVGIYSIADGAVDSVDSGNSISGEWKIHGSGILELDDLPGDDLYIGKLEEGRVQMIAGDHDDIYDETETEKEYFLIDKDEAERLCGNPCYDSLDEAGASLSTIYEPWTEAELSGKSFYVVLDDEEGYYQYHAEFNATHLLWWYGFAKEGEFDHSATWSIADDDGVLDLVDVDDGGVFVIGKIEVESVGIIAVRFMDTRDELQNEYTSRDHFFTDLNDAEAYCLEKEGQKCLTRADLSELYTPWQESELIDTTWYNVYSHTDLDNGVTTWYSATYVFSVDDVTSYPSINDADGSSSYDEDVRDWELENDNLILEISGHHYDDDGTSYHAEDIIAKYESIDGGYKVNWGGQESDLYYLPDGDENFMYDDRTEALAKCESVGGCVADE